MKFEILLIFTLNLAPVLILMAGEDNFLPFLVMLFHYLAIVHFYTNHNNCPYSILAVVSCLLIRMMFCYILEQNSS